jgi:hypothetical protein
MASKLSWRDAWLLPLIAVCTTLILLVLAEGVARTAFPERKENACVVYDHGIYGHHYKPNCISTMKAAEGPWYTNRYNECGYRSNTSCGPVAPGVRRIALVGSSVSEGYLVEYPHTFAAQLGDDLTAMCRAPVDVQNLGATGYIGRLLVPRMAEALRLKPQAVLYFLSPYEVQLQLDRQAFRFPDSSIDPPLVQPISSVAAQPTALSKDQLRQVVSDLIRESRAVAVAQHFMFGNLPLYLSIYLNFGDKADFLRPPFTPLWQARLRQVDMLFAALAEQAHQAGVPLILVFVPHQAEIAVEAGEAKAAGIDPRAFPAALEASAIRHGAVFIDSSEILEKQPDPAGLFYRVDGHPSGKGQPIIARYVASRMAAMTSGPFSDCRGSAVASAAPARP